MEYAIYLRKSREDKEMENYGQGETLARHERKLVELAKSRNYIVTKIYREVVSGESIQARPQMQELLRDVETGIFEGVLVVEVERLARGNTKDQGIVAETFKYSNTKIITPNKVYDSNKEDDENFFEFGLFMSRFEYKTINRRLNAGRLMSVNEGKFLGNIAPLGYDRKKLSNSKGYTLVINKEEEKTVKRIFELYSKGNYSIGEVAIKLDQEGYQPRISNNWSKSTVKDVLRNIVYIGKIRWEGRKQLKIMKRGQIVVTRPRNTSPRIVDGLHEAIIDVDTWKIVQERLKTNVAPVSHNDEIKNPLVRSSCL